MGQRGSDRFIDVNLLAGFENFCGLLEMDIAVIRFQEYTIDHIQQFGYAGNDLHTVAFYLFCVLWNPAVCRFYGPAAIRIGGDDLELPGGRVL